MGEGRYFHRVGCRVKLDPGLGQGHNKDETETSLSDSEEVVRDWGTKSSCASQEKQISILGEVRGRGGRKRLFFFFFAFIVIKSSLRVKPPDERLLAKRHSQSPTMSPHRFICMHESEQRLSTCGA